jgi:putative membrane protein insertion efficiency factor
MGSGGKLAIESVAKDLAAAAGKALIKLPVHAYRWTLKPLVGSECRHLPTCSQYALEAIDCNGAWRGSWLALSRICRCHPWGSHGFDPVPHIAGEQHRLAPWRYGRWAWRQATH